MDVNKAPRWLLVWGFLGFMALGGLTLRGAFADIGTTKSLAYETKTRVDYFEKRLDRFEDKIDKIGDRLGVKT